MKINDETTKSVPFMSIKGGESFMYGGCYFIKIRYIYDRDENLAINLYDGTEKLFVPFDEVYLVRAEVNILRG